MNSQLRRKRSIFCWGISFHLYVTRCCKTVSETNFEFGSYENRCCQYMQRSSTKWKIYYSKKNKTHKNSTISKHIARPSENKSKAISCMPLKSELFLGKNINNYIVISRLKNTSRQRSKNTTINFTCVFVFVRKKSCFSNSYKKLC